MEESSRSFNDKLLKALSEDQCSDLRNWLRPLQQALSLEAEGGFNNLLGRGELFHSFMSRKLGSPPFLDPSSDTYARFIDYAKAFEIYPESKDSIRRRLVTKIRQYLHSFGREIRPIEPLAPPRLKINFKESKSDKPINSSLLFLSPVSHVKGVGPKISQKLLLLGLLTVRDLLNYYPRDYVDYSAIRRISALEVGETATTVAFVRRCSGFKSPRNPQLSIIEIYLEDITGRIKITRFCAGYRFRSQAYIKSQVRLFPPGAKVAVSGLVKEGSYGKTFIDPYIEVLESENSSLKSNKIGHLLPVYSLTEGLSAERFRSIVETILPLAKRWSDPLEEATRKRLALMRKNEAIIAIHRPQDQEQLTAARRRLVFDEFLFMQLRLLRRRYVHRQRAAPVLSVSSRKDGLVARFLAQLTFVLTNAQKNVLAEIESDLGQSEPMTRLVQGDVGSGKTVVAVAALLNAVEAGWQGALMAPTEVLAEQHYQRLCDWLISLHVNVELLTGSTPQSKRQRVLKDLSNGSLKILVGTHALIEDTVSFSRLGLVVIDEQHRFGVHQRNRLLGKGLQPHLLTMTATPIPRTLALSLHGDLDVSHIDELPPGRTPIKTSLLSGSEREKAYDLIRDNVNRGQRAYFVLPLVDDSSKLDLRSAVKVYEQLSSEILVDLDVGLLHGRMSSREKKSIIDDFVSGKCQVLVSTTVVEVGVDVPEATVMVIDHADRFGLAQLHQLRGRVGRGPKGSHCLLINDSRNPLAKQRLEVLVSSNDGFEISELDMRLRGPGQVLGTKQSGLPDFALASLIEDAEILELARIEAQSLIDSDPELNRYLSLKELLNEGPLNAPKNTHLN